MNAPPEMPGGPDWLALAKEYRENGEWDTERHGHVPNHPQTDCPADVRKALGITIDPDLAKPRNANSRASKDANTALPVHSSPPTQFDQAPADNDPRPGITKLFHHKPAGAKPNSERKDKASEQDRTPPAPLVWLDMSKWDSEPTPKRQWAIPNRVPLNQVGLFSGEGGAGKSQIELLKDAAHVLGRDWYSSMPVKGPAFYIGAEDGEDEIHIRLAAIAKHFDVKFSDLIAGGLYVLPLLGKDAVLCAAIRKSGGVEVTALYKQIYEAAGDLKPKNISIDTLSRAFAGNELDRVEVYGYANHMQALALVATGSVTTLSHPSLQGINSGSGLSGSTAWHNAFRFRQYLKYFKAQNGEQFDPNIRELEFLKNQYGSRDATIVLRYDPEKAMFMPVPKVSGIEKLQSDIDAETIFLRCLDDLAKQGRRVGDKPGANFAPAIFADITFGKKVGKQALKDAMGRLFESGKIAMELNPDVKPSKAGMVILRKSADDQGDGA